jgi:hypothetical protein
MVKLLCSLFVNACPNCFLAGFPEEQFPMIKKEKVLAVLDRSNFSYYCHFPSLGHPYSYLIDARLNVFRGGNQWAVAIERLGYNPRAGFVLLDVFYYGNCLRNFPDYNQQPTNCLTVYPLDEENFFQTTYGEAITPDATHWLVRGKPVELSHHKPDYVNAGIHLPEDASEEIRVEEAARLLVVPHRELFRATDGELYQHIPAHLEKILVLDEWHHKDFVLMTRPDLSDQHLRAIYASNPQLLDLTGMDYATFADTTRQQQVREDEWNRAQWDHNRPSAYETWHLIAQVIESGDPAKYTPTLEPNTHWQNWPDSGSL